MLDHVEAAVNIVEDLGDIHLHFARTSASWLNMVERFFAEISDKPIRCGTFKSVADLENRSARVSSKSVALMSRQDSRRNGLESLARSATNSILASMLLLRRFSSRRMSDGFWSAPMRSENPINPRM